MGHRQVEPAALFCMSSRQSTFGRSSVAVGDRQVRPELSDLRRELASFCSNLGQPSIDRADDPDADRRLLLRHPLRAAAVRGVHLNLAYRWFCRLGLDGGVPDHSTFSKNPAAASPVTCYEQLFETILRRCIKKAWSAAKAAVDASLIKATNGEGYRGRERTSARRSRDAPSKEYLAVLDDAAFGAATEVTPKFISPVDPAARWTRARWRTRPSSSTPPTI